MGACCGGMKTSQQHKSLPEKNKPTPSENEQHQLNNDVVASQEASQPGTLNKEHHEQSPESNHEEVKHDSVAEQLETVPAQEPDLIVADKAAAVSSEAPLTAEEPQQPVQSPGGDGEEQQQVVAALESVQLRISEDNEGGNSTSVVVEHSVKLVTVETTATAVLELSSSEEAAFSAPESTRLNTNNEKSDTHESGSNVEIDEVIQVQSRTILESSPVQDSLTPVPVEDVQVEKVEEEQLHAEKPEDHVTSIESVATSLPPAEEQTTSTTPTEQEVTPDSEPVTGEITAVAHETVETLPAVESDFGLVVAPAEETHAVEKAAEEQTVSADQLTPNVEPISEEITVVVQDTVESLPAVEADFGSAVEPTEEKLEEQPLLDVSNDQTPSVSSVEASLPVAEEQTASTEQSATNVEPISEEITVVIQETVESLPTVEADFGSAVEPAEEKVEEQPLPGVSNDQTPSASSVEASLPVEEEQTAFTEQATPNVEPFSQEITPVVQEAVESLPAVEADFGSAVEPAEEKVEEKPLPDVSNDQTPSASSVEASLPVKEEHTASTEQATPNVEPISEEITAVVQEAVESLPAVEQDFGSAVAPAEETQAVDKIEEQPATESEAVSESEPVPVVTASEEPASDSSAVVLHEESSGDASVVVAEEQHVASGHGETSTVVSDADAALPATASDTATDAAVQPEASIGEEVATNEHIVVVQESEEQKFPTDNAEVKTNDDVAQQQTVDATGIKIASTEQDAAVVETLPGGTESTVSDSPAVVVSSEERDIDETAAAVQEEQTSSTANDAVSEQVPADQQKIGNDEPVFHQEVSSEEVVGQSEVTPVAIQEAAVAAEEGQQTSVQSADESQEAAAVSDGPAEHSSVEQSAPETAQTETSTSVTESIPIVNTGAVSESNESQSSVEPIAQGEKCQNNDENATVSDDSLSIQPVSRAEESSVGTLQQTLGDDALSSNPSAAAPSITITDHELNAVPTPIDPPAASDTTSVSPEP